MRAVAFNARVRPGAEPGVRLAVIATRALGGAVSRNRAKRRVREAFRRALASSRAGASIDLLITVRPEALTSDFGPLQAQALAVLREAVR